MNWYFLFVYIFFTIWHKWISQVIRAHYNAIERDKCNNVIMKVLFCWVTLVRFRTDIYLINHWIISLLAYPSNICVRTFEFGILNFHQKISISYKNQNFEGRTPALLLLPFVQLLQLWFSVPNTSFRSIVDHFCSELCF